MKKSLLALTLATAFCSMQAENKIFISNIEAEPGTINLELKLNAEADAIAGYQAKLTTTSSAVTVDEGDAVMTANKIPGENSFFGTHNVGTESMALNILSYSGDCSTFAATTEDVVIANIPVTINEAGTYTFTLSGIILADATGKTTTCSDVAFTVTVKEAGDPNDINGDDSFDFYDVLDFLDYLNAGELDKIFDFNEDDEIDFYDVLDLLDYLNEIDN